MRDKLLLLLVLILSIGTVNAQEINCRVVINYDKITNVNTQIFKSLETSINDFINKTVWTEKTFENQEKISCSMFITINAYENNNFDASLQVQSSRPIFNSGYSSNLLNINDKDFQFQYIEFQQMYFNPNSYDSNLMSTLAFYIYIILGIDAESFELDSGLPYFQKAQEVVNLAMPGGGKGWQQSDRTNNRYYLVADLLSGTFKPYLEAIYKYHFQGLDLMHKDLKAGKKAIVESINSLEALHKTRPNAFLTRLFFDAKADELVAILSGGPAVPADGIVDKLSRISPLNSSKWNAIKF